MDTLFPILVSELEWFQEKGHYNLLSHPQQCLMFVQILTPKVWSPWKQCGDQIPFLVLSGIK